MLSVIFQAIISVSQTREERYLHMKVDDIHVWNERPR